MCDHPRPGKHEEKAVRWRRLLCGAGNLEEGNGSERQPWMQPPGSKTQRRKEGSGERSAGAKGREQAQPHRPVAYGSELMFAWAE